MDVDIECRNYRLRLGLPELSQPFFGSWLSPDSDSPSSSPSFLFDFDSAPPCSSSSLPLLPVPAHSNTNESHTNIATVSSQLRIQEEIQNSDNFLDHEGQKQEPECRSGTELSNLWLQAGRFCEGQSRQSNWEVTHVREEMPGTRTSYAIAGNIELGSRTKEDRYPVSNSSNARKGELTSTHFTFDLIQESDLVRAALRALQGVPTAVSWLEELAAAFSSTAADRSSEHFTTLWTRSSSSCSLSKVLTEFAKAGRVACQLDFFTSFFLNQLTDPHKGGRSGTQNACVGDSGRKKRKRQNFNTERNSERPSDTPPEIWEGVEGLNISPHCHTNQAFAAAVKTFMEGNLVSIDKIRSSVNHRRQNALGGSNVQLSEVVNGEAGLVFGFGCGDVTLLELFLHSHKQREQLQALAALCRIDEGASMVGSSGDVLEEKIGVRVVTDDVNVKGPAFEIESHLFTASRNASREFPRGADLLSYLFNKLLEADTLHLELTRFLFERACQPYTVFIRSWLYLATVQDPFGEFFVKALPSTGLKKRPGKTREQDALLSYQVPTGVKVPCFLEEICTPLLRAGQQLQVLSKLLDTPSASNIVDSPFKSSGSFQDTLLAFSCWSDILINKSSLHGPVAVFNKKAIQGDAQQPKRSSQILKGFHDGSLAGLAKSPLPQQETDGSEVIERARLSNGIWLSSVEDGSAQQAMSAKEVQEAKFKSYQGSMTRSLMGRKATDDIPIASPTRPESSQSLLQSTILLIDERKEPQLEPCLKSMLMNQVHPLKSESNTSFISDFRRGTSWPILGLPRNPFLSSWDEGNHSSSYIYTIFPDNNGCWDVSIHWTDPYSVTGTRLTNLVEQDWSLSDSTCVSHNQKVDVDHPFWLKNLEDYLSKQLTVGLDEQIVEADYASLGFQTENEDDFQSADTLGFQPWSCSMRMQRPNVRQRNAERRLHANSHWELVDSSIMDASEKQYLDDNCSLQRKRIGVESTFPLLYSCVDDERHCHLEVENGTSPTPLKADVRDPIPVSSSEVSGLDEVEQPTDDFFAEDGHLIRGSCHLGSGSKWESYLHSEYQQVTDVGFPQYAPSCDDDEDDEEIPLSVAVKLWIDEEILYQYKRTSRLTIRLLQESLHLQDHFTALRRYYFMERGDWAEYFLSALCKYEWNRIGGEPQLLEVQSMLRTALQNSSCDGDEFADRLYIVQSGIDGCYPDLRNPFLAFSKHQHSLDTFVDCSKLEAFDFIKVGYKVEWPLCLIITPSAVSRYSSIFTFLLRMKLTISALADVWRNLQVMGYSLNKGRRLSDYQEQNKKFRTLQLFRQQIGHVVTTLQRYTESQILHVVWCKFLYSVENEVNDIQDLEKVHSVYLDDAYHQCFLSRDMEDAKNCIDVIMQCTLDFRNSLLAANLEKSIDSVPVNDEVYQKVLEVKTTFEVQFRKLYSYHQRPEPQYSVILSDFWMCLNYNGCLESF